MKSNLLNPVFYERTKDGEVFYDISSRLIKDRVIYISEPITKDLAATVSSLLFMLNTEDDEKEIQLWLNTPGGDVSAFFAIYDMMQLITAPVKTVCLGEASSAGAFLLASGSYGHRTATPNSKIMIHQIQVGGIGGTGTDVAIAAAEIGKLKQKISEVLARHSRQPIEKVLKDCEHDMYLSAEEALEYGLIDRILPVKKDIPDLITAESIAKAKANKMKAAKRKATNKKAPVKKAPVKKAKKAAKKAAKKTTKKTV